jgi:hypothetical protein
LKAVTLRSRAWKRNLKTFVFGLRLVANITCEKPSTVPLLVFKDNKPLADLMIARGDSSVWNLIPLIEMESVANSNNLNSTKEEIVSQVLRGIAQDTFKEWGGGVIPTQSNSSRARHTTQSYNHDEYRIKQQESKKKQQETDNRLEESLSHISRLEASHATMQSSYATMQAQLDSILLHI